LDKPGFYGIKSAHANIFFGFISSQGLILLPAPRFNIQRYPCCEIDRIDRESIDIESHLNDRPILAYSVEKRCRKFFISMVK